MTQWTTLDIAHLRLQSQWLVGSECTHPGEVVKWLGAVQAQDYLGAKWALGLRMQAANDDVIERAISDGSVVRTHVMRPTWHFVAPADIRWIQELTAPRVRPLLGHMNQRLDLDEKLYSRSNEIIARTLQGGKKCTRAELGAALAEAGIVAEGLRLIHIIMRAELDAVICSGPRRGKQFTYMLLDERAPQARSLERDEALVELIRRYFTGHGPATVQDFSWWSGLTITDAKAGLKMVGNDLAHGDLDGQTYWFSPSMPTAAEPTQSAFLLPTYDEFLVGFAGFDKARRGGRPATKNLVFDPPIVIGGRVVGHWRRALKKTAVIVEFTPFEPLTDAERQAVSAAAQRYGDFLGLSVTIAD